MKCATEIRSKLQTSPEPFSPKAQRLQRPHQSQDNHAARSGVLLGEPHTKNEINHAGPDAQRVLGEKP